MVYSLKNISKERVQKDIIGYAHPKVTENGNKVVLTLRSGDNSVRCGCRFKYIQPEIEFTYNALTDALNKAIDLEAAETNNQFTTEERQPAPIIREYDYEGLRTDFQEIVGQLMEKNQAFYTPRILQITDRILGKNKKFTDCTLDQVELMDLVVEEIKDLAKTEA